jgi:predicted ATP-dependent protease
METEQELQDWYEKDKKIKNDYRDKNREEINRKARETYQANKEEKTRRARELYQLKKQKKQEYYQNNKERILKLREKQKNRTKNNHLLKRYGISLEAYEQMVEIQNSKCYICKICVDNTKNNYLHVDHDHNTGKVRKLLCMSCNASLGLIKENKNTLQKMIEYLNEHK